MRDEDRSVIGMSWIRKIFNDDWTDKFDSEGDVSIVKLKIIFVKLCRKRQSRLNGV